MRHHDVIPAHAAVPVISAADALAAISTWTDLTEVKRRDLASSVQVLSRWLRTPLSDIPMAPTFLRQKVLDVPPGRFGVGLRHMRNVKHRLRFVLRRLEVIDPDLAVVAAEWVEFIAAHALTDQDTIMLFAKFCTVGDIAPVDVTPETIDGFERWLETRTLCRRPKQTTNRVRGLWRRVAKVDPALTSPPSKRDGGPKGFILPLAAFPASFQAALTALGEHLAGKTRGSFPEDDEAPLAAFRPLRPSTIECRLGHARWAASALVASGVPIEQITDLRCLVVPVERAGAILDVAGARYDGEASSCATHIGDVLRIIARHHVGLPARQVQQIVQWARPLRLHYSGMTAKNQRTVREMLSPEHEQKLLHLAEALFASAAKLFDKSPKTAAQLAMRGLAVALLLHTQMRLSNLVWLHIDRHLQQVGTGRDGAMWINVPVGEVKNSVALSFPLDEKTRDKVRLWIDVYRPHLSLQGCPFLFPGARSADKPITPQAMRDAIKKVMADYVGVVVTPHQFRHVAASIFLDEAPGHYDELRLMLGHRTTQTTMKSYAGIEGERAHQRFDDMLRDRSKLLAPQSPKRKPRQ